jgi:hypothetical protein
VFSGSRSFSLPLVWAMRKSAINLFFGPADSFGRLSPKAR